MDDFVIEKISRGMLIVSLNGHEISFEGEMFFPNNEFHFSHIFPGRRSLPITPVTVPEAHVAYSDEISSHALMLAWLF